MATTQPKETTTTITRTFLLNYNCVYEVFKRLDFNDCMNFAEAYEGFQEIADRIFKKKFNNLIINNCLNMDRILYHAGATAKSLTINLQNFISRYTESDLIKIVETCKELRCLEIIGFDMEEVLNNPFSNVASEKLEVLTLTECVLRYDKNFFDVFKNLKCLNLNFTCLIDFDSVMKCFENNQQITSFTFHGMYFEYAPILPLLPKLERLSVRYLSRYMKLDSLSKLPALRHFTINCFAMNINEILSDLAKVNILEELVLLDIEVDDNTFALIKSLEHLRMLTVTTFPYRGTLRPSVQLPTKLKALKLGGFRLFEKSITTAVQRLRNLTDIHLQNCVLETNNDSVKYFDTMADFFIDELVEQRHRPLNVAVVSFENDSTETVRKVENLRITSYGDNLHLFEVEYQGVDHRTYWNSLFPPSPNYPVRYDD